MQEITIQWDPMMEQPKLGWGTKLFILYLLIVLVISVVKSIGLAAQLWRSRRLPKGICSEDEKANLLAASALGVRYPIETAYRALDVTEGHLKILQQANNKFCYLWEMCSANTDSIKRLTRLTLLLSVLVLVHGAIELLREIMVFKSIGIGFLSASMAERLEPFGMGIFVCAALYSVFTLFKGMLERRRARWNYFYTSVESGFPSEQV